MNNSFSNIKTIAPKSFIESVAGFDGGFLAGKCRVFVRFCHGNAGFGGFLSG